MWATNDRVRQRGSGGGDAPIPGGVGTFPLVPAAGAPGASGSVRACLLGSPCRCPISCVWPDAIVSPGKGSAAARLFEAAGIGSACSCGLAADGPFSVSVGMGETAAMPR